MENQTTEETIQVLVVGDPALARAVITRSLTSDRNVVIYFTEGAKQKIT